MTAMQWSARLNRPFSDLFEDRGRALWVSTGTAANCLGLPCCARRLAPSSATATRISRVDEAGAPGFYTHGAKLMLLDGAGRQADA